MIAEIELALLPKPEGFFSGIVFFAQQVDLLAFVDEARTASLETRRQAACGPTVDATLLEYFDANSLGFIRERFPETPEGSGRCGVF